MNQPPLTIKSFKNLIQPQVSYKGNPSATVWSDRHGHAGALNYFITDEYWLHVTDTASFRLSHKTNRDVAVCLYSAPCRRCRAILVRRLANVLAALGLRSAVRQCRAYGTRSGRRMRPSKTQKTRLAYGLKELAYPLQADDAVVFRVAQRIRPLTFTRLTYIFGCASYKVAKGSRQNAVLKQNISSTVLTEGLLAGCALERVPGSPAAKALTYTTDSAPYLHLEAPLRQRRMSARYLKCVPETLPNILGRTPQPSKNAV